MKASGNVGCGSAGRSRRGQRFWRRLRGAALFTVSLGAGVAAWPRSASAECRNVYAKPVELCDVGADCSCDGGVCPTSCRTSCDRVRLKGKPLGAAIYADTAQLDCGCATYQVGSCPGNGIDCQLWSCPMTGSCVAPYSDPYPCAAGIVNYLEPCA